MLLFDDTNVHYLLRLGEEFLLLQSTMYFFRIPELFPSKRLGALILRRVWWLDTRL